MASRSALIRWRVVVIQEEVEGDEVALGQQLLQGHVGDAVALGEGGVLVDVVGQDRMSKPDARLATSLPMEPSPTIPRVLPGSSTPWWRCQLPSWDRAQVLQHLSPTLKDQPQGKVGHRMMVGPRSDAHRYSPGRGRLNIDGVVAHPGSGNHLEPVSVLNNSMGKGIEASDNTVYSLQNDCHLLLSSALDAIVEDDIEASLLEMAGDLVPWTNSGST